eukprot:9460545-Pyramimonas_sp.AAC.1
MGPPQVIPSLLVRSFMKVKLRLACPSFGSTPAAFRRFSSVSHRASTPETPSGQKHLEGAAECERA